MKRNLIILANSMRPGGRCIAGICPDTGDWMRPITRDKDRAIPDVRAVRNVKLLDIMEIDFPGDQPEPTDRFQRENWYVDSWDWEHVDICSEEEIIQYYENDRTILYSPDDRVEPSYLETLSPGEWKSLQLVKTKVEFYRDTWKRRHWRVGFHDGSGRFLDLKVTYPAITQRLNNGEKINNSCILTISLAAPWEPEDHSRPSLCYKLAAGVIELTT